MLIRQVKRSDSSDMSMSALAVGQGASSATGYGGTPGGPRSPSSSVCSFAGSVNSETMTANKYLMKTLCLAKKSTVLPGKADYAKLLTCGLGKFPNVPKIVTKTRS